MATNHFTKAYIFFERHLDKVYWHQLSGNPSIPIDFFDKHLDKVDWNGLSRNPSVPLDFFERHLDKVNWVELSENQFHWNFLRDIWIK